jgi:hypothetical protein
MNPTPRLLRRPPEMFNIQAWRDVLDPWRTAPEAQVQSESEKWLGGGAPRPGGGCACPGGGGVRPGAGGEG